MTPDGTCRAILGCTGTTLSPDEAAFFARVRPWGFILFARNVETPDQVRRLTGALRAAVGWNAPVLVDQEGGRVARLRAPVWRAWQPALDQCECQPIERAVRAMWLRARLVANELVHIGIDVNCTPVADVACAHTHPIVRDRTYGTTPSRVAQIARANAEGCLHGGVLPVLKHIPGHGRATLDSHLDLPRVSEPLAELETSDFAPFRALNDLPLGMSAHVVYAALDDHNPGTISASVQDYVRRRIGFHGLMMSDDLSMNALSGTIGQRVSASLAAGIDLMLHCNADPDEMEQVARNTPPMTPLQRAKADAALARRVAQPADIPALESELDTLLQTR